MAQSVAQQQSDMDPVNPLDFSQQTKRDVAIYCGTQLMADAIRCHYGIPLQPLKEMDEKTRIFYLQTCRNAIDKYLSIVQEREPVTRGDLRGIDGGKAGQ